MKWSERRVLKNQPIEIQETYFNYKYQISEEYAATWLNILSLTPLFFALEVGEKSLRIMYSGLKASKLI